MNDKFETLFHELRETLDMLLDVRYEHLIDAVGEIIHIYNDLDRKIGKIEDEIEGYVEEEE